MSIYVQLELTEAERAELAGIAAGDEVHLAIPGSLGDADQAAFQAAEIAVGNCPPEWLAQAHSLRWLQFASMGVDGYLDLDWPVIGARMTCTNLGDAFAEPVAQTCLAGLLALYRGIDRLAVYQAERDWQRWSLRPTLGVLHGQRVLMLGAGYIARQLAGFLDAFECRVTMFARNSGDIHTLAELDAALPDADIVCALLPHTPLTDGLLDEFRIGLLKPGAVFVNAGRGSLVDENALVRRLSEGSLGGAVLDVTRTEPLPADDPLWKCPRVVLTQHTAGGSSRENTVALEVFADNLHRYRAGRPLRNVIDWPRGY